MQDRYTGDLGDFGKYALLKALAGNDPGRPSSLRLGVQWYRVPDEDHLNDGRFIEYLVRSPENDARFRACDEPLHEALGRIVRERRRQLESVEEGGILPAGTRFFSRALAYDGIRSTKERAAHRDRWHADALDALAECALVFCDPDNGLECAVPATAGKGPKFTLLAEVAAFSARGQSVVVYHHIGRRGSAAEQVRRQLDRLARVCRTAAPPFALRWHRGSSRAYLVVPHPPHARILAARARALLEDPWRTHWSGPYT